ncbi:MAG: bifunctional phosphoribosyl-AMP cyclohydrolase/phosphoribosyl-ATP diphosphatase HisIE [Butyrivibrio sp.]|uniref:bifunctional phosphoribosyl-AMP cyclohydrolase/phosphoribosyl-ATP diphosphatase HisIE n=1 Tax=Butyrivibrio sp. TaxID=28121 RepID=UPI001B2BD9D6|nr:bifunctional phosphoribosyl-AMP cyclohydrolase/phosphoribosyl-ATP diphosphatase HisIE [Butyrivibrio sp.]MBO5621373.1 bifunctional phosphoribosyl-AMP cyclohydrolase/phosphoribosyl-ATP diphosphatase HisIE [Butyrivibrio sp.]MBP3782988.1 bifunctional phosphoribosyl-AMP cyclohydrolase/phosphoribosyl-ATP diphosphatase HisIE [Butyrivibrio sp.]MBP3813132.1 bifunctional phosphoribosyl-AMP cyclohydrolase/phosphoribosyl-ATP diphosphatase HisIE [Butyrivibrio sp.]
MQNNKKKVAGYIFLLNKTIVSSSDRKTVISDDPVSYAGSISDNGADEIIVFDMSESGNDAAHEEALDIIKDICKEVDVPVTGAGNVKRMEDIKKLLYAGCKKAALNFSKPSNIEILKEVSEKFGKEKIVICYDDPQTIDNNKDQVESLSSELIRFVDQDGAKLPDTENDEYLFYDGKDVIEKDVTDRSLSSSFTWADLKKNSDGMVPVIVQDYRTDQVLMLAYMNEEAYNKTLETGKMTYFSRSRNELWIKGETSSHYQFVKSLTADCDLDTILAKVKQIGAACHTGSYSCFFNDIAKKEYSEKNPQKVLGSVYEVIKDRKENPREGSYTNYLFDKGIDKILKKVGEEATEMVIAAKNPNDNEVIYEMSDFLYHMMVLMAVKNVSWEDITDELSRR